MVFEGMRLIFFAVFLLSEESYEKKQCLPVQILPLWLQAYYSELCPLVTTVQVVWKLYFVVYRLLASF